MIKQLDWAFLGDTIDKLEVSEPDEGYDIFEDIYRNIINQYLIKIGIKDLEAITFIEERIYYNYSATRIDLDLSDFIEQYPKYLPLKDELTSILH